MKALYMENPVKLNESLKAQFSASQSYLACMERHIFLYENDSRVKVYNKAFKVSHKKFTSFAFTRSDGSGLRPTILSCEGN